VREGGSDFGAWFPTFPCCVRAVTDVHSRRTLGDGDCLLNVYYDG